MDITNITKQTIDKYFKVLSNVGYTDNCTLNKVLTLVFIEELLTSNFSYYITECDYKSITNVLYCILGKSCMFELPSYETFDSLIHKDITNIKYRFSEDNIIRKAEESNIRID